MNFEVEIDKLRKENIDLRGKLREKRETVNRLEYEKAKLSNEVQDTKAKLEALMGKLQGILGEDPTQGSTNASTDENALVSPSEEASSKRIEADFEANQPSLSEHELSVKKSAIHKQCGTRIGPDVKAEIQAVVDEYRKIVAASSAAK